MSSTTTITLALTLGVIVFLGFDMKLAYRFYERYRYDRSNCEPFWRWWLRENPFKLILASGGYLFGLFLVYAQDFSLNLSTSEGTPSTLALTLALLVWLTLDLRIMRGQYRLLKGKGKVTETFLSWWFREKPLKLILAGGVYLVGLFLINSPGLSFNMPHLTAGVGAMMTLALTVMLFAWFILDLKIMSGYYRTLHARGKVTASYWKWWLRENPFKLVVAGGIYLCGLLLINLPDFSMNLALMNVPAGAEGSLFLTLALMAWLGLDLKIMLGHYRTLQTRGKVSLPFWRWWPRESSFKIVLAGGIYLIGMIMIHLPNFSLNLPLGSGSTRTSLIALLSLTFSAWFALDLWIMKGHYRRHQNRDEITEPFWRWWVKKSPFKLLIIGGVFTGSLSLVLFPDVAVDVPMVNMLLNPAFLLYLISSDPRLLAVSIFTILLMVYLLIDINRARFFYKNVLGDGSMARSFLRWWVRKNRSKLIIAGSGYLAGVLVALLLIPFAINYLNAGPMRYLKNANQYFQQKKYQEAARELRIAIKQDPANAIAHVALAQTLLQLGSQKEALEAARTATRIDPKHFQAHLMLGSLAMSAGDTAEALAAAQTARLLRPEAVEPVTLLARIYTARQDVVQAATQLREFLQKTPENQEIRAQLINNALSRRDYEEANREAETGFSSGASIDLHLLRAKALLGLGRYDEARSAYNSAAVLDPKSPVPHLAMAELALRQGNVRSAIASYEEVLRRDSSNAQVSNNLASLMADHDFDLTRAAQLAEQAYQRAPRDPAVNDTLGWVFYKQGKLDQALPLLRVAVTGAGENPSHHYHLGAALLKSGQTEAGINELKRALQISQEFDGAATARKLLQK